MALIRIVVKDRALLAASKLVSSVRPVKPVKPVKTIPRVKQVYAVQPPPPTRSDWVLLCQGVDIALEYFNSDDSEPVSTLTAKARAWADQYFQGFRYAAKRSTALLKTYPNLFNLRIEAPLRLIPTVMSSPSPPEPEAASPRELRRAERQAMNSEAFPEFAEPTLASDAELDEILSLRSRQHGSGPATKPNMRVDAAMLRGSGLMSTLPEFLGQLARANLETETMLASNPDAVRFELDEEEAADQLHVEMNLFAGLVESQRRRRQQGVVMPGESGFKLSRDDESKGSGSGGRDSAADVDSGDDTDASTSTAASLHVNRRKRKSVTDEGDSDTDEAANLPNKIRIQYDYPPSKLRHFDMKRRKLVSRANPAAVPNDPFMIPAPSTPARRKDKPINRDDNKSKQNTASSSASSSSSTSPPSSSSSSSSGSAAADSPALITKVRVASRSPDGSRSSSPDRVIVLRHPVLSPPLPVAPTFPSLPVRPSPAFEDSSLSSEKEATEEEVKVGGSRKPRIRLLRKEEGEGRRGTKLIEEVE